jgi:arylsulfatase A-like enzyme
MRHRLRISTLGLVAACAGLLSACQRPPQQPDVLLISIDTARADHFSFAGDSPVMTPNVDALAAQGVAFLQAVSPVPTTLPAHASLLTGRLPTNHGVRTNGLFRLADSEQTMAENLTAAGYQCGAFVAAAVLDSRYGLDQGFAIYDDELGVDSGAGAIPLYLERSAEAVVAAALDWLGRQGREPVFTWVHLFEPHAPYSPPEPERSRYGSLYAGEIAYVDRIIGQLLDTYPQVRRSRPLITVLTADHGESLGEHQESTHGVFIYDATVRVPLVIAAPGLAPGQCSSLVSLIDIVPTVLDLTGVAISDELDGVSLRQIMESGAPAQGSAYIESYYSRVHYGWSELRGLRTDRYKLIVGAATELYDLDADPTEMSDLSARQPEVTNELRDLLESRYPYQTPVTDTSLLDEESRSQLSALGYATETATSSASTTGSLPDPRERMAVLARRDEAWRLLRRGRGDEAIRLLAEVVAAEPNSPRLNELLGSFYASVERWSEALAAFERVCELTPGNVEAWTNRGALLIRLGRLDEALAAYDQALTLAPDDAELQRRRHSLVSAMKK